MLDKLLMIVAPHPCYNCGKLGTLLCIYCKYDIVSEPFGRCMACGRPAGQTGVCTSCRVPYTHAWCVGERSGALEALINGFKFDREYAAHKTLAELMVAALPTLPAEVIVVPVPTVASHIRQRGYDHTRLIAKSVARQLHRPIAFPLRRITRTKQRDASRSVRFTQAKEAFEAGKIDEHAIYLLIDDVVTTGATMQYAAQALKEAGASEVWVVAIARQPLD